VFSIGVGVRVENFPATVSVIGLRFLKDQHEIGSKDEGRYQFETTRILKCTVIVDLLLNGTGVLRVKL
jgi:hypothetical protein